MEIHHNLPRENDDNIYISVLIAGLLDMDRHGIATPAECYRWTTCTEWTVVAQLAKKLCLPILNHLRVFYTPTVVFVNDRF